MLKCRQVTRLAATDDYKELSFLKKAEFKIHLMMCSHCKRYFSQIVSMGCEARKASHENEAQPEQLNRMQNKIMDGFHGTES